MVSVAQTFSHAVNLIPFLNSINPTRTLMASNMMKQAIPLLNPQSPLVETGEELSTMQSSNQNIVAKSNCIIVSVDANTIVAYEPNLSKYKTYSVPKPSRSNQGTCSRLRVIVTPSQVVKAGEVLAECQSSADGKISLGANLLAAFMCWEGLGYEDSMILSKRMIIDGTLDSLHIVELESKTYRTLFGDERITSNIPNINQNNLSNLDEDGIIKRGSIVRSGDVLVGKLTPTFCNDEHEEEMNNITTINQKPLPTIINKTTNQPHPQPSISLPIQMQMISHN